MVSAEQIKKAVEDYNRDGFAVIENFLSDEEVQAIRDETSRVVKEVAAKDNAKHVFGKDHLKDDHYSSGGDKKRVYFEPSAVDSDKNELKVPVLDAACKLGFGLHNYEPFFKRTVTQKKITDVFRALDYADPRLIQTMVNFKNPRVGGEFIPHQDTSYLTTTDPSKVVGFWFALDDATVENGCVQFIPGSHKWSLVRKLVRPEKPKEDGSLLEWTGPMAIYDEKMYVNVPAKKGALVLIHGLVMHKSEPNRTDKSRWAFAFHAFDGARCKYVDGWLPSTCQNFIPIYAN